jgi:hypothetical protein
MFNKNSNKGRPELKDEGGRPLLHLGVVDAGIFAS